MNIARRFLLKLTGASVATLTMSPLGASTTVVNPPVNKAATDSLVADTTVSKDTPVGTLILKRGNGTGDRLLVLNNSDSDITLQDIKPGLVQINGRIFDVNHQLRHKPLVVGAHSVESCRIKPFPEWQVSSPQNIHEVRCSANSAVAVAKVHYTDGSANPEDAVFNLITG
ncbi:MAG: hypothetical protein KTR33_09030 [Gammaproteobacteria bacterium]|nr:hypothetical protein [Gammaproteobacteria bacterium]